MVCQLVMLDAHDGIPEVDQLTFAPLLRHEDLCRICLVVFDATIRLDHDT